MNNIILHGLKSNYKSLIGWIIGIVVWSILMLSMFPAFIDAGDQILKLIEGFPPELLKSLGFNREIFTTFDGFYSYIATYSFLIMAMYAAYSGIKIFAEDNKFKTNDFLYTKPISRTKVFFSKLVSGLYLNTIMLVTYIAFIQLGTYLFYGSDADLLLLFKINTSAIGIVYFTYFFSILLGTVLTNVRSYVSVAMPIGLIFFILDIFAILVDKPFLAYFTPFGMFNKTTMFNTGSFETKYVVVAIILMIIFVVLAYLKEKTKDVKGI